MLKNKFIFLKTTDTTTSPTARKVSSLTLASTFDCINTGICEQCGGGTGMNVPVRLDTVIKGMSEKREG